MRMKVQWNETRSSEIEMQEKICKYSVLIELDSYVQMRTILRSEKKQQSSLLIKQSDTVLKHYHVELAKDNITINWNIWG